MTQQAMTNRAGNVGWRLWSSIAGQLPSAVRWLNGFLLTSAEGRR
jgi:hypothetical protein